MNSKKENSEDVCPKYGQEFGLRTRWYILRCLAGEEFEWVWRDVLVVKYLFRRE
jgi:hypothetical protein